MRCALALSPSTSVPRTTAAAPLGHLGRHHLLERVELHACICARMHAGTHDQAHDLRISRLNFFHRCERYIQGGAGGSAGAGARRPPRPGRAPSSRASPQSRTASRGYSEPGTPEAKGRGRKQRVSGRESEGNGVLCCVVLWLTCSTSGRWVHGWDGCGCVCGGGGGAARVDSTRSVFCVRARASADLDHFLDVQSTRAVACGLGGSASGWSGVKPSAAHGEKVAGSGEEGASWSRHRRGARSSLGSRASASRSACAGSAGGGSAFVRALADFSTREGAETRHESSEG